MQRRIAMVILLSAAGCGGPRQAVVSVDTAQVHLGESWFTHRAEGLSLTVEQAKVRDAAMSEDAPPEGVWDDQLATEAASLWLKNCAACHGVRGDYYECLCRAKSAGRFG